MTQSLPDYFKGLAETHRKKAARAGNPDSARNHEGLAQGYETLARDALSGVIRRPRPLRAPAEAA